MPAAAVVVKQERLSPEPAPAAHRRWEFSGGSPSPPAGELIADIPIDHPSCSKQHAVFQCRLVKYTHADGTVGRRVKPYIIDLGSGNGTFLNNKRTEPQRYYELKQKDVLKFGEYVLQHESSDTSELDGKEDEGDYEEEAVSES
ncbi:Smad nuclear-interacting protein 1 [Heterocephalus glaber]|uniref:Smad nuclear-interacting protein 1 n=1 Tax=Heterocephalus glaber TaxID=10181 RepID=G5CB10_HETGA|nr:Smad nuclear-interacting protein 1 [Heterocephalus glaber]